MPRDITVTFADGTSHIYQNAPDTVSPDDVQARAEKQFAKTVKGIDGGAKAAQDAAPQDQGLVSRALQFAKDDLASTPQKLGNLAAGAVRGAGSIGATILAPYDMAKDAIAGKGLSLESNRQRRSDMDATLQDLGADPNSRQFQAGKVGTEIAGTLGVGGAVANVAGRVAPGAVQAAPALFNAIRTGGMSTGVRAAPGFVPQAVDLGTRALGGAINGGLSAGIVDPKDAPVGMAVGGAIPVVTKAAGAAGKLVGNAVSSGMARNNAGGKIAGALGDDAGQVIADIQTHYPKGAQNIPLSAAAISENPKLAQLEQGSRLRETPSWFDFDQRQGKAVFDNVMDATKEAGDIGALKSARADNWTQAWAKAEQSQKPRIWVNRMTQFGQDMEQALRSPQSSNPEVRAVLESINAEMDRVGPSFSPAHLQHIRANLNGKVQPMSNNVFKSAPRDNPAIISLKNELDDILNVSTGGKWQNVLEGYAKDSDAVRASAAAGKVRSAFVDDASGRALGPSLNPETPLVTEAGLGRAMNAARMPDKSLALSSDANAKLEATLEALRKQNLIKGIKRSATAGGGSDTIPNAIASHVAGNGPSLLMQLAGAVKKIGTGKTDAEMAKLLSNPDELAKMLETLRQPVKPNRLANLLGRSAPTLAADQ